MIVLRFCTNVQYKYCVLIWRQTKTWDGDTECIDLTQNKDKRWAVVDAVMNIRGP
jgi:hypothetical protein